MRKKTDIVIILFCGFLTVKSQFAPTEIANLSLWLRADSLVTKDANNFVSAWGNCTGSGTNLNQVTPNLQPLWSGNIINGNPVIRFDGANDFLNAGDNFDIGTGGRTLFVVAKSNNLTAGTFVAKSLASGVPNRFALRYNSNGVDLLYQDNLQQSINSNPAPSGFTIFSNIVNRNSQQVKLFKNSSQIGVTLSGIQNTAYNFNSTYRFLIGAYNNATDAGEINFLNGDIAEIIMYDTALPDSSRNRVEQYLRLKYAAQIDLGPDISQAYGFCGVPLTAPTGFSNYQWSNGASGISTTVNRPGKYWINATDAFGYTTSDTIIVNFPGAFPLADDTLCLGSSLNITSGLTGPYTHIWSNGGSTSQINIANGGLYSLLVTDTSGCVYRDTLLVLTDSFAIYISLGADTSICAGSSLGLQSGNSLTAAFQWSDGTTGPTTTITTSGQYNVTVTSFSGCQVSDSILVNVVGQIPLANFNADTVCLGNTTQFTDLSTATFPANITGYLWTFAPGQTNTTNSPSYTFGSAGIKSVTLQVTTNVGCSGTVTKNVFVRQLPTAVIQTPLSTCTNSPFTFSSSLSNAAAGDALSTFNWNFGDGNTSTTANPTHTYLATGTLPVSLTVGSLQGCSASDTETISIASSALTAGNFTLNTPASGFTTPGANIMFNWNNSVNASSYILQVASNPSFTNIVLQSAPLQSNSYSTSFTTAGLYYWRVLAANFCGTTTASNIHSIEIFTPGNVPNLAVWLRADSGVVLSGGTVSQWSDGSGNNLHASQSTPANAPSVVSNVTLLNNKPALLFDGSNDVLNGLTIPGIDASSSSVFVVTKGNAQTGVLAGIFNIGTLNNGMWLYRRMFTGRLTLINDYVNNTQILDVPNSMPNTGFRYGLFGMVKNFGSESRLYINSTESAYSSSAALSGTFMNSNYVLGFGQGYGYYNGEIAEVIVYKKALSGAERTQVENYLYTKYAPPVSLGPDINNAYSVCPVTLNAGNRFLSYTWSTGDTAVSQISIKKSGTYWINVTDVFGRTSSDTVVVNIPVSGTSFDDTTICNYDNVLLFPLLPGSPYQFSWNNGSTSASIPITASGNYFCLITDTNNCVFITDTISVAVDSFALRSLLPADTNICVGNTLAADTGTYNPVYFIWSNNELGPSVTIGNLGTLTYQVTVTDNNNCVAKDTAIVRANQTAPQVAFITANLCFGDSATLVNQTTQVGNDVIHFFEWDFGDGNTSNDFSPTHLYNFPGTYPVELTLATDSGCSGSLIQPIKVSAPPTGNFSYPNVVCAGSNTVFYDNSVVLFNDSVTSWKWTFGGLDTSSLQIPTYEFNQPGTVSIQLIVATDVGCADTVVKTLEVFAPFVAAFSFDKVCIGDSTVFIDTTASLSIVSWLWNFGDGTPFSLNSHPKHQYVSPGNYFVTLKVENAIGCVDTSVQLITVVNPPVANIGSVIACEDVPFLLADSSVTFSDPVANWRWNVDGTIYNTASPQHIFSDTGLYPITLKITTLKGCVDSVQSQLTVRAAPNANFAITPLYGEAPADIQFSNLTTDATGFDWNFGDGGTSTDENPIHTFIANDTFQILLQATNQAGCKDTTSRFFIVAPTALDIAVSDVEVIKTVQADGSVLIKVDASLSNIGTRVITDIQLYATVGSGSVISEDWTGLLESGQTLPYSFSAEFVLSEPNANTYVCVRAREVNQGEQEVSVTNNQECATLTGGIQLAGPSPNPVMNKSGLGIILPKPGTVTIDIADVYGRYVVKGYSQEMPVGRTDYELQRQQFVTGEYFIRIYYNDERIVRKFIVK
ncbi:MAG: PKD domain-containing protein [Bacteroidetes bacterium]|nr:PKD domain-containing protein [Bacteroidota bacterium]